MTPTMRAAVYEGNATIKLVEAPIPQVGPRDALVKVMACGICGTDLRILNSGHRRIPAGAQRILGHELAGEVVAVGNGVDWPKVGTRVALSPNMGCGFCDNCIRGFTQLCDNYISFGVVIDGGFAEFVPVPEKGIFQGNVIEIPDGVSYEEAAINEPLSCVFHGLTACHPQPGDTVLIVGAGPIGLMYTRVARAIGAGKIVVSELSPERCEQAREMGAEIVINPREEDLPAAIGEITQGKGVDVAIIAAPSAVAQSQALEMMAYHGRINFFGGLPKGAETTHLNANLIHYRELTVTGTTGQTVREYRTTLNMIANRNIEVRDLITGRYPLGEIAAAVEYARSLKGLKTMVFPC